MTPDLCAFGVCYCFAHVCIYSNVRLIMENLLKYGLRSWKMMSSVSSIRDAPTLLVTLAIYICPMVSLLIEKLAASGRLRGERLILTLHMLWTCLTIGGPIYFVHVVHPNPLYGVALLMWALCMWMKQVSYAHANHDLRVRSKAKVRRENALFCHLLQLCCTLYTAVFQSVGWLCCDSAS